jgi:hypothetical protein
MTTRANRFALICVLALGSCAFFAGCTGMPSTFNAVQLTPSAAQTIDQGQTLNISANVLNDTSGAGVTWSVSGGGTLNPTTTTTATYNAPASVAAATTATVTATSKTYPTKSTSLAITVEPAPVITTASLPAGSINAAYSATVNESGGVGPFTWLIASGPAWLTSTASTSSSLALTGTPGATDAGTFPVSIKVTDATGVSATSSGLTITVTSLAITTTSPLPAGVVGTAYSVQFAATGGTSPYTWSVSSGSTLPAGLSLSNSGLLSGTPTTAVSGATFGITVTDSETPAVAITVTFTLSISSTSGAGRLNGNYAFEFSGFNSSGVVVAAGSFTADGQGNIKNGVADFNSIGSGPTNQTFTGSYTVGSDGRGQLKFSSLTGSPTYAFAIDSAGNGRMIEADGTGTRGSGQLELQTVSTCTASTISGEYAFGASGFSAALDGFVAGPVALAGRFTATPPGSSGQGNLSNGEMDANTPGFGVVQEPVNALSGTYQATSESARCSATLTPSTLPNMTFSVYPVSTSEAFLVETDKASVSTSTTPFVTVGSLLQQVGYPFTSTSGGFTGASVGGLVGQYSNGSTYVPDVAVVSITSAGLANFNMLVTENRAGTVSPFSGAGTFIQGDSFGRVATQGLNQEIDPVFYTINTNEAFCLGEVNGNPFFGIFQPQSAGPFSAATIKGTFVEGTAAPAVSSVSSVSGVLTLDGKSAVSGTEDEATSSGLNVAGTYALTTTGPTDGSGTMTLTSPAAFSGAFFIVSPTEAVMVSTTSGDANPVLIVIGHP